MSGRGMRGRPHLEIAFEFKELRDICEREAEAKHSLGESNAEMLRHRLADMEAAKGAIGRSAAVEPKRSSHVD